MVKFFPFFISSTILIVTVCFSIIFLLSFICPLFFTHFINTVPNCQDNVFLPSLFSLDLPKNIIISVCYMQHDISSFSSKLIIFYFYFFIVLLSLNLFHLNHIISSYFSSTHFLTILQSNFFSHFVSILAHRYLIFLTFSPLKFSNYLQNLHFSFKRSFILFTFFFIFHL